MALPPTVVDRLTREPVSTPGWSSRLLLFSCTLLLLMLFLYVGLEFGYLPKLGADQSKLDSAIAAASNGIPPADQVRLASFYSQLANVKTLLGIHTTASSLFPWLQGAMLPNVYLARVSFVAMNQQLLINGVARSVRDVADQLSLFEAQPSIDRVIVNNVSIDATGLWRFDIVLQFGQNFFVAASSL